jgi:PAS domain S-box-containing protein
MFDVKERTLPYTIRSIVVILAVIWSIIILSSMFWNMYQIKLGTRNVARIQARDAFLRDVVYRRWNSEQGNVYVPVTKQTLPNPYLENENRDVTTMSGINLTMMNPAYMTRQVHELALSAYNMRSHITSLKPIRPENAPDQWEKMALKSFQDGENEVSQIEGLDGISVMRLMKPLLTEKNCLLCHAKQGYQIGDIRGGISIAIPMSPLLSVERSQLQSIYFGHGLLWVIGLAGIGLGTLLIKKQILYLMQSQNSLEESENKYMQLFSTVTDTIILYDTDSLEIIDVNKAACDLFGYNKNAFMSLKVPDVSAEPEKSLGMIKKQIQGMKVDVPLRHIRKSDGTTIPVEIATGFFKLGRKSIGCGIFRDLTKKIRLQTEKEVLAQNLKERVKELTCLYKISKLTEDPKLSLDQFFKETLQILVKSWQYPESTIASITYNDSKFYSPNYQDSKWKQESDIIANGKKTGIVEVCYLIEKLELDEGPFLKEERELLNNVSGLLGRIIGQKDAEIKLKESEEQYRSMMCAVNDFVYICSKDFKIEFMNSAMTERVGFDAIESFCYKAINDLDKKCSWCPHDMTQKGKFLEVEIISPKDNRSFLVSHSPLYHDDGTISKMTIYKDISHIKQLQAHLIQTERLAATGQLAASIAHEINSPLQAITSTLSLMKKDNKENEVISEKIDLLKGAFVNIRETVRGLLDLNRPRRQKKKASNINKTIEEAIVLLKNQLKKNNIEVILNLSEKMPNILASPQKLNQVFLNLCNNAAEAMTGKLGSSSLKPIPSSKKLIRVKSQVKKKSVVIQVVDNGPGISEADLISVFDPFYTKKKEKGLGVGLSICYEIISDHGGTITAENSSKGGAAFTIELPIIDT